MIISSPDDCVVIKTDEIEKAEIEEIHDTSENTLGFSEYTQDIYKYLKVAEVFFYLLIICATLKHLRYWVYHFHSPPEKHCDLEGTSHYSIHYNLFL